jgi:hypothetical protein
MVNGNAYAVADPRCVPGFARSDIILALLYAACSDSYLSERLAKKQKLPWGNRRMANDAPSDRSVLTDMSSVYWGICGLRQSSS